MGLNDAREYNYTSQGNTMAVEELRKSFLTIEKKYDEYDFLQAGKELINQLNSGVIQYYLDYYKEIGYTSKQKDPLRVEGQYILNEMLKYILFTSAPIIPVTVEEAWETMGNKNSLFLEEYPSFKKYDSFEFDEFLNIKNVVNKSIEQLRASGEIKKSNEVKLEIWLPKDLIKWMPLLDNKKFFSADVTFNDGELKVEAFNFKGIKCERCWNYYKKEDMDGNICSNCAKAIE